MTPGNEINLYKIGRENEQIQGIIRYVNTSLSTIDKNRKEIGKPFDNLNDTITNVTFPS
jgi:hypothetical protein